MALDDRLSDLLVDWEQSQRDGREPTLEELCKDAPDLLPVVRQSIDSLKATRWMFEPDLAGTSADERSTDRSRAALHDTGLPVSHLTVEQFAASIFQSGLLSPAEIHDLNQRLTASDLPGEAREIASRLVTEGKLTRYQASVLLKASKDPLLIDNYVILDTLDTGGMGLVFKALHRSMNRVVALKLLPAAMMSARDTVKRFQREVQAAAALSHPNVVAAYDAHQSDEIAYLVLEYVEGINLFRLVKEQGPLPVAVAANYVRQAATGLAYLHSRGIIHRDVKPANLILAADGTVKLLDMGLVRFASAEDLSCAEMDQELTQAGIVIGTVAYMSPEQALDTRSADQRSDIYSLGCTLFFLLTGRSLYHEETGMKTLLAHREQPVPTIREFCEEAPVSLDAVYRTMVAKRPADRLQTMTEVVAALDACVPGLAANSPAAVAPQQFTAGAPSVARNLGRGWKRLRSSPLKVALATAVLAGLAAGGTYLAGILIRIKSDKGNTDIYVDDPKATVEVTPGVANPRDSASQKEGSSPLRSAGKSPGEQTRRGRAFSGRNRRRMSAPGAENTQTPTATAAPQNWEPPLAAKTSAPASVDRLVAEWALTNSFATMIWIRESPRLPIQSRQNLPSGNFHIETIIFKGTARVSLGKMDIDRLASLSELKSLEVPFPSVTNDTVLRLATLTRLRRLSLAHASISDACLHALAGMTHLEGLDLSGIAGITDAGLGQLAKIKSLNILGLNMTMTTEEGLFKLQRALHNCSISASHVYPGNETWSLPLPPPPGSSDGAWAVWLLDQGTLKCRVVTDVDPTMAIAMSKDLPPIDFHIRGLSFLQPPPDRNGMSDSNVNSFLIRRLGNLQNLRELTLEPQLPPSAFEGLVAIKSLQRLRIGDGNPGNAFLQALASLTGLTALIFDGDRITDTGVRSLATLKGLTELRLSGHARNLHGSGFEALSGLTRLQTLDVSNSGLDDDGARGIGRLASLEKLGVRGTWMSGKGLAELASLPHLKVLNLSRCRRLQSPDVECLMRFPALERLSLADCRIDDSWLDTLRKFTKLQTLILTGTALSPHSFDVLRSALPRCHVVQWPESPNLELVGGLTIP